MPIKRLTVFSALAAALFLMAPVQATTKSTTSKTHVKAVTPTHAQHHKATPATTRAKVTHARVTRAKTAHAKATQHASIHASKGKHVASRHKPRSHGRLAATSASAAKSVAASVAVAPALPVAQAGSFSLTGPQALASVTPSLLHQLPVFNPAPMLAQSVVPSDARSMLAGSDIATSSAADDRAADQGDEVVPALDGAQSVTDLRKALIAMAMKLRDIRYVRGGRDPSTGFDCSGFVRYVFAHAVGMQLPNNSASQFLAGLKVKRSDMKPGDLVFFRTHGRRAISHVGIYISNGRFIHSPTTGKSVEISSLDSGYWAKRFAGAKRPEAMAQVVDKG